MAPVFRWVEATDNRPLKGIVITTPSDVGSTASAEDLVRSSAVSDLPSVEYSPQSPLRNPVKLVRDLISDLWGSRELIAILFMRDLRATYRQSYFGYAWILAPPLLTTAVWMFLNSQRVVRVAETPIPYPAFVIVGTTFWAAFAAALTQPLTSFNSGRAVFTKLKVPPEAFIAAGLGKVLFDLVIRFVFLVPVLLLLGVAPPLAALLCPAPVCCLLLLGLAVGVLLVPLGSLYHDVGRAANMLMGFAMYLTPVVFPPPTSGWAGAIVRYNPVTPSLSVARDWLTLGESEYVLSMWCVFGLTVILLLLSLTLLRVSVPHVITRLGM